MSSSMPRHVLLTVPTMSTTNWVQMMTTRELGTAREVSSNTEEREERTTARCASGAVDGAPPARCSGTSTLTVPAMCTSGVLVALLLLLADEERDEGGCRRRTASPR